MSVFQSNRAAAKGSALAISLVILTAITLISVSALQRSGLQGRMVGNIQHKEEAFHATSNELEDIFQYYMKGTDKDDSSAEAAAAFDELYDAANSTFKYVNEEKIYDPIETNHDSNSIEDSYSQLTSESQIQFRNIRRAEGSSIGQFQNHNYNVSVEYQELSTVLGEPGKTVSSQTIGIRFLAPAQ